MELKLITPEKIMFEGEVTAVQIPGMEGDFGVLPGHAPFVSTIRPGVVTINEASGNQRKVVVVGGVAEVNPEQTILLAEKAEDCSGLEGAAIEAKLEELTA